jgi:predicted TIM-barrel fold metal-dependent hydrolase
LFPNTIPPFAGASVTMGADDPASAHELELRWAGIRAHNRWLSDFCAEVAPGRRLGVAQLLFEDVERALEEIRFAATAGLLGGVLIPNPAADSCLPQLHAPEYEPIWAECEALGLVVTTHGGGGVPDYGPYPSTPIMMFLEFGWYAMRPLVRLMMSGVFERHPGLHFVMTEAGNGSIPETLEMLEWMLLQVRAAGDVSVENRFGAFASQSLSLRPSEYWHRQCFLGASFMTPRDARARHETGVDRVMWGADYPHTEGTFPYTAESYRHTFADIDVTEVALMLGLNAARAYRLDIDALGAVAKEIGPRVEVVHRPLAPEEFPPPGAGTMAFPRVA